LSLPFLGRAVVITGASSGIGEACARAFAAAGASLWIAARRGKRLEALADALAESPGGKPEVRVLDVRKPAAVEAFAQAAGPPEVLVNNAGLSRGLSPLHEGDLLDWEEMIDTNLKGLLLVNRAFLPGMVAAGKGHLIHMGSIAGREVYPGGNVYCATKHAVDALTRSLRLDLNGTGVRVSTVDPGFAAASGRCGGCCFVGGNPAVSCERGRNPSPPHGPGISHLGPQAGKGNLGIRKSLFLVENRGINPNSFTFSFIPNSYKLMVLKGFRACSCPVLGFLPGRGRIGDAACRFRRQAQPGLRGRGTHNSKLGEKHV